MIQNIAPHTFHNEFKETKPEKSDIILLYRGQQVFLKQNKEFLTFEEYEELFEKKSEGQGQEEINTGKVIEFTYLFSIDETGFFIPKNLSEKQTEKFFEDVERELVCEELNIFRTYEPMYLAFAGITGANLFQWYETHKFCGFCGNRTEQDHKERALRCPECGGLVYPTISPAVIVGVRNGNKLLLTKYSRGTYKKYALIAGFTEFGESMEDTVHREVMEEVGLKVKNLTYYKSQPWAFTGTELIGFFADLDGDDSVTLEEDELKEGTWFEREELPPTDGHISLTAEMIETFRAGMD